MSLRLLLRNYESVTKVVFDFPTLLVSIFSGYISHIKNSDFIPTYFTLSRPTSAQKEEYATSALNSAKSQIISIEDYYLYVTYLQPHQDVRKLE